MAARGSIGERPLATRYKSLFVVGRGGMGSVEAALQLDPHETAPRGHAFERVVALKRLLPDAARDKRRVDMFLREAKLASLLDHPNVVSAYDYGELDGELYLAMEYVEGQSLARILSTLASGGGVLPVATVAYLLAEVCRGLHAAHDLADPDTRLPLNLVHRDVSPQNVMIGYDGRVRLLDFGVAKIETENHTKTGEVKGKTAYMSPEQAMGDPIDRRSDLFGVGAILFECLALRRMWGDGTDMDVIRKLALEEPPALDATGRKDLPAALSTLYARLVARSYDQRPATAAEIATALDAFVADPEHEKRALRKLLDAHFAGHAAEQRARLTSSLHEVAPAQAEALRESVLPSQRPPVTPVGLVAPVAEEPSPLAASSLKLMFVLPILAVVLIAFGLKAATKHDDPVPVVPVATVPTAAVTAEPRPTSTATSKPAESQAAPPPKPNIVPANPTVVRPPPSAAATTATTTAKPATSASAKPRDVDDHPF